MASGEMPGLQHATTSITHKSIPIAGRNLDYTLLEMLGETADPKLIICNEIPNFTQLAPGFTVSLVPGHQRNHL